MPHDLSAPTFKVTGAARLHRAASRERSERGRPPGWGLLVMQVLNPVVDDTSTDNENEVGVL